jgi:ribose 5-phosphate isomerase RpiB
MRIAVLNEVSACSRNIDILNALRGFDCEVFNLGMTCAEEHPQLTYIHTGLMAAMLLNLGAADFVIGGCGTGQGFLISAMQYPGVFCGLISEPSDAYLFSLINDGNCISLPLLKGYGWAGELNLKFVLEKLFDGERGSGYPKSRSESQKASRKLLAQVSKASHKEIIGILKDIPADVVSTIAKSKKFVDFIEKYAEDNVLKAEILNLFNEVQK